MAKAMPPPARAVALLAQVSGGILLVAADHRRGALIAEMREPERDGILPRGVRQLVHEQLYSEDIDVRTQSAQCRDAQRHPSDQVIDHALTGKLIEWHRVAVARQPAGEY